MAGARPLLLDSHVLIWLDSDVGKIPKPIIKLIQATEAVYVSAITAYELGLKYHRGTLPAFEPFAQDFEKACRMYSISILQVDPESAARAAVLEWENRDPFDRVIAAQAITYRCRLVTSDTAFTRLVQGPEILWDNR